MEKVGKIMGIAQGKVDRANETFNEIFTGTYGYHKPFHHMTSDLKGRVALITGGAGMVGGSSAELFAASGADIAIWDIDDEWAAKRVAAIEKLGRKVKYYHVDAFDKNAITENFEQFIKDFGRVDILMCNVGPNAGNRKPVAYFDDEKFLINYKVDLTLGTVYLSSLAIPYMIKQGGGNILNTTSVCGVTGLRLQTGFVGAKFAISAITKSMALEYGKYNIRVNALAPGSLPRPEMKLNFLWDTCDFDDYNSNFDNPASMVFDIAMRRPAYPTDMAGLMLYLVSDDASYTTGQVICVDGGWTAGYSADY